VKLVFFHPTGNQNVRIAATGLAKGNLLFRFHTAIACFSGSTLFWLSTIRLFTEFRRRLFDSALKKITITWPWIEMGRLAASKAQLALLTEHEKGPFCIDAVYKSLDKHVASSLAKASLNGVKAVYAFEDGAAFSFREAKRLGLQCFYDLPTGYWRASRLLLEPEFRRSPEWMSTFTGFQDSPTKLIRKDEELRMADQIIVASQFTADTLKSFPGRLKSVQIIPYGFPPVLNEREYRSISGYTPLKILFVGKLTQQKGIADLFAAVESIGSDVQLTLIGQKPPGNCKALNFELQKHNWIQSASHPEVLRQMREHDVLIFPSLFDGFGLVITEAMSQGTPVITTERTAGPSFIKHNYNGWLINAGSVLQLQSVIAHLLQSPEIIEDAGRKAMSTARSRPWSVYSDELNAVITKHLGKN
jgi:glycosyltransferase involved in cell wall biosynthesis